MPPFLALFLTVTFAVFLFWRDSRQTVAMSTALWIPLVWVLITGSRFVSEWFDPNACFNATAMTVQEGSPVDRVVFLLLILGGVYVLYKPRIKPLEDLGKNEWLGACSRCTSM